MNGMPEFVIQTIGLTRGYAVGGSVVDALREEHPDRDRAPNPSATRPLSIKNSRRRIGRILVSGSADGKSQDVDAPRAAATI